MGEKTYEMLWDCKYCATTKLLGKSQRCCPLCGAPQAAESRYFPSDAEKVAVEDHVFVGADVYCPACREANSKNSKHCTNCGSPLDSAALVAQRAEQVIPDATASPVDPAQAGGVTRAANRPKARSWLGAILVSTLAGLLLLVFIFFTWKRDALVEVTRREWTRSVEIERYGWVQREAFCDEMPGGARSVTRSQKQRGSEQVPNGEDCQTRKRTAGMAPIRKNASVNRALRRGRSWPNIVTSACWLGHSPARKRRRAARPMRRAGLKCT